VGSANGVYVRTADYLVLTIGDPSAATATGTGVGAKPDERPAVEPVPPLPGDKTTVTTVGQPPVSLVLKRSASADAAPSPAATPPPPAPGTAPATPVVEAATFRRLSSAMGSNVTLSDGSTAGQLEDFVFSTNGAIDFALLNNGGTFSTVPFNALTFNAATGFASIPLTRAQFATIPTFGANDLSTLMTNRALFQRVNNTFISFRDINGQPIFNNIGIKPVH